MLKRAIAKANVERVKAGQPKIPSFGYRDMKVKGVMVVTVGVAAET